VKAPSRFELLFGESAESIGAGSEPFANAVAELPEDLRRIVQRVSSRKPAGADA
jgi:hypothetical protein